MKEALATAAMTVEPHEARAKVAEYRKAVRDRHNEEDAAILRGYRAIAKGFKVIDLPQMIRLGGVFEQTGLPRIAVGTASHQFVYVERTTRGSVTFLPKRDIAHNRRRDVYGCPDDTLPRTERWPDSMSIQGQHVWNIWRSGMRAMIPPVPPGLRPAHSLDGYATMFQVEEWAPAPAPPGDPALLKHIGGDLYAVVAVWDLTPLEQAVLAGRNRG